MPTPNWIAGFPFVLILTAGVAAYAGGLLLRRGLALATDERAPGWPSAILRGLGLVCMAASFVWTWSLQPRVGQVGLITTLGTYSPAALTRETLTAGQLAFVVGCGLLVLGGLALAGWALNARIRNAVVGHPPDRLAERAPYNRIRRPLTLGIGLALLGGTLLAGTLSAWACLILATGLGWILQEFDDLDLRSRFAWVADQQRRIPRFIPRSSLRRARRG
jgi:protein-S-isoprenylcysteine O-methyltransferase Ste14